MEKLRQVCGKLKFTDADMTDDIEKDANVDDITKDIEKNTNPFDDSDVEMGSTGFPAIFQPKDKPSSQKATSSSSTSEVPDVELGPNGFPLCFSSDKRKKAQDLDPLIMPVIGKPKARKQKVLASRKISMKRNSVIKKPAGIDHERANVRYAKVADVKSLRHL